LSKERGRTPVRGLVLFLLTESEKNRITSPGSAESSITWDKGDLISNNTSRQKGYSHLRVHVQGKSKVVAHALRLLHKKPEAKKRAINGGGPWKRT